MLAALTFLRVWPFRRSERYHSERELFFTAAALHTFVLLLPRIYCTVSRRFHARSFGSKNQQIVPFAHQKKKKWNPNKRFAPQKKEAQPVLQL